MVHSFSCLLWENCKFWDYKYLKLFYVRTSPTILKIFPPFSPNVYCSYTLTMFALFPQTKKKNVNISRKFNDHHTTQYNLHFYRINMHVFTSIIKLFYVFLILYRSDSLLGWYTTEMKILAIQYILLSPLLTIIF